MTKHDESRDRGWGIKTKSLYTAEDMQQYSHVAAAMPGTPPYLRGPYPSMYSGRPWTIRQYAGFSTAKESNAFYRQALAAGQHGLSVAFDLATHRGYDSDHPEVAGDVGKAGVAIDSVEDMKRLFDAIPLDKVSVSMTMNGAVVPIMAFFIVAAQEQGVAVDQLSGTMQNDILKEFLVRNTYIYAPSPSMRLVADLIRYATHCMPKFNPISISGYHFQEAGATPILELALTLADGVEYVRAAQRLGLSVDAFAPRLSFFFGIGMNMLLEAAKLRAARVLWAELMRELFGVREARACMLRTHCQTSGVSLTAQDPYNNIVRTTVEALAAVLGGTQSLHTNAFDEAIALPSTLSARIALNTQLVLQHESGLTDVIDPLAGSYYVESLTGQAIVEARRIIQDIEQQGGMTRAIEHGTAMRMVAVEAAKKQARLDSHQDILVGVNAFRLAEEDAQASFQALYVDLDSVMKQQRDSLYKVKHMRDKKEHARSLDALERACLDGEAAILERAITAARARATLGEISSALERGLGGRYQQGSETLHGVYAAAFTDKEKLSSLQSRTEKFSLREGRRPRMLVVKLGQDGHDRGAKTVGAAFADFGFDIDIGPLFQTPHRAALQAVENDVHVLGVSTQAAGHRALVPQLLESLRAEGAGDILVLCGGVIPSRDHEYLKNCGVFALFGPGSNLAQAAEEILDALEKQVE